MNIIMPSKTYYTIYTKNNCSYCSKAKSLLENENPKPLIINCDHYLNSNRNGFLLFIKNLTGVSYNTFPMVFYNGLFIGGYTELKQHYIFNNTSNF
jgi:glutaredoxin